MDFKDQKQVAIVTGSNTGIGRETALSLAKDGMKVFMACRSTDRGREAASYIREVLNVSSIMSRELKFPDLSQECVGGREQKHLLFAAWILGRNSSEISKLATIRIASLQTFCLPLNCNGDGKVFEGKGIQESAVDPGAIFSDIWRTSILNWPPMSWVLKVAFAPTWDGAMPVYHAATTPWKTDHEETPLRLFARGGFTWWGVTRPNSTPLFRLLGLLAAAIDWPVRYLSKGLFFSEVVLVPANPQAYDEVLASKLWSLSADVAGLSE